MGVASIAAPLFPMAATWIPATSVSMPLHRCVPHLCVVQRGAPRHDTLDILYLRKVCRGDHIICQSQQALQARPQPLRLHQNGHSCLPEMRVRDVGSGYCGKQVFVPFYTKWPMRHSYSLTSTHAWLDLLKVTHAEVLSLPSHLAWVARSMAASVSRPSK